MELRKCIIDVVEVLLKVVLNTINRIRSINTLPFDTPQPL